MQEGDKILLSRELMDDFNLTKQNSVKVKMQTPVIETNSSERQHHRAERQASEVDDSERDRTVLDSE